MAKQDVETVWYENTAEGTFHEVVKGTDTERRMRSEQRSVVDEDGDESFEQAFRKCSAPTASKAKSLPGYVASPEVDQAEADADAKKNAEAEAKAKADADAKK